MDILRNKMYSLTQWSDFNIFKSFSKIPNFFHIKIVCLELVVVKNIQEGLFVRIFMIFRGPFVLNAVFMPVIKLDLKKF